MKSKTFETSNGSRFVRSINSGTCLTIYEPCNVLKSNLNIEDDGTNHGASDMNQECEQGRACDDDEIAILYLPKCICVLSVHSYLVAFREYLTQLHRLGKSSIFYLYQLYSQKRIP